MEELSILTVTVQGRCLDASHAEHAGLTGMPNVRDEPSAA